MYPRVAIGDSGARALDDDLGAAIARALKSPATAVSPARDASTGRPVSSSSPATWRRSDDFPAPSIGAEGKLVINLSSSDHRTVIEARYLTGA
jgi:hypothetical protein